MLICVIRPRRVLGALQFSPEAHQPAVCETTPAARAASFRAGGGQASGSASCPRRASARRRFLSLVLGGGQRAAAFPLFRFRPRPPVVFS
jgi:hypothetical protein